MSLSVCTLVRNRNGMLERLVEGFERSRTAPHELIVMRAGGEDPRPALGRATRFHVVVEDLPDSGELIAYSVARNAAARRASGRYLCFMDADMIPGRELVGSFSGALREEDAVCVGDLWYADPAPVEAGWEEERLRARSRLHPERPVAPQSGWLRSPAYGMVWGSCFAIRRERFHRLGGFDEGFQGYAGEDTDLAMRSRDAGAPLLLVWRAPAYHQHHDVFEPPVQQFRATLENARRFHEKHGWWPMGGWLAGFREMGLIRWTDDRLDVVRDPSPAEIATARRTSAAPFRGASAHEPAMTDT